ncbi:hypothetical protein VTJ49DRAFT_1006 [Mycothermus thermophilus]|uniref:DOMON domain-containing protein n=1 Tax=Humicola insolens TaxID=85995 RepID=A0ABR3VDG8_HUMIN
MLLAGRPSPSSRWLLQWLVLCISYIHLTRAQDAAVSSLFVPDTDTVVAFNLPPDSDDINFYVRTPDWYQYTAVGFGTKMADSLMLVLYASEDRQGVTVSPRTTSGNTEPTYSPTIKLTIHESLINANFDMIVNATCHGCQSRLVRIDAASPMIFAVGPALDLSSDDLDARIRRHTAYGFFTADLLRATGPGGIPTGIVGPSTNASSGATIVAGSDGEATPGGIYHDKSRPRAVAHGVLYAIAVLAFAPLDTLIAGALGPRWAWMHAGTATVYFLFVVGALVPGVLVSGEHVATQQFRTPHQILGFISVVAMAIMYFWGFAVSRIKRSAKKRGQEPPQNTRHLAAVHRWVSRLVWLLLLVNVGLGMKLSEQRLVLILAYVALALGIIIVLVPVYFCVWKCSRHRRKKEEQEQGIEMPTIYDHNYYR